MGQHSYGINQRRWIGTIVELSETWSYVNARPNAYQLYTEHGWYELSMNHIPA
jgi:hypothetical protein